MLGDEAQPTPQPEPQNNPFEKAFGEMNLPRKNEISIGTVLEREAQFIERAQMTKHSWRLSDVKEDIKKEIDFEEPVLRGPIEVAKGDRKRLAVTSEQLSAFEIIYDLRGGGVISHPHYALVETTEEGNPKTIEAELKHAGSLKPKTRDHFIISAGLARELGVDSTKEIRIKSAYQKIEDANLDEL